MINPDDSVFPSMRSPATTGLTKREWFAGLAMQGILANATFAERGVKINDKTLMNEAVIDCVDALIIELNKKP